MHWRSRCHGHVTLQKCFDFAVYSATKLLRNQIENRNLRKCPMKMFDELFDSLDTLRQRTARFRRICLHLHSIDSHDWGKNGDSKTNDPTRFEGAEGYQAYADALKPHFDMVCVTDHMKCGYACDLSTHQQSAKNFVVLPGMEVNYRSDDGFGFVRLHLLAIFPEGTKTSQFAGLFHKLDVPNDDGDRDGQRHEVTGITLQEWNATVKQAGGISVAAHVDNAQGIRCGFRQTARDTLSLFSSDPARKLEEDHQVGDHLKKYLARADFDAIEIHKESIAEHYRWEPSDGELKRSIPTVLTFDAHRVEDFGRADRVTYVKMTEVGLPGLRDAFQFSDTRVRFLNQVPSPPEPRLLGIEIDSSHAGFFPNVTVAFAENLNCLIGARGSGKSTLVEALRYVFGLNRRLTQLPQLEKSIRGMQQANLVGSSIKVAYRTATGEERVLVATYDPQEDVATKVYDREGVLLPIPDVEAAEEFPIRLFGWNEVETLGREPHRQRDLLDRLMPDLDAVLRERTTIRTNLASNRHEIAALIAELRGVFDERDGFIRRYTQRLSEFNSLNTVEVQSLFGRLDLAQGKLRLLGQLDGNAEDLQSRLSVTLFETLLEVIDRQLEQSSEELREWWLSEEKDRLKVDQTQQQLLAEIRAGHSRLGTYRELLKTRSRAIGLEIATVEASLTEQLQGDNDMQRIADLRSNAEGRLREVTQQRRLYLDKYTELQSALAARGDLAETLAKLQQRIAGIRVKHNGQVQERLNDFLPAEMKVEIDFRADGDVTAMEKPLYDLYSAKSSQRKRIRRVVQSYANPVTFAAMLLDGDVSKLVGKGGQDPFTEADAQCCLEVCVPFSHDPGADVPVLSGEGDHLLQILEFQEVPWDDYAAILLNGGPINEKSPGQRSSAMLPLIALTESTPLVIDQPEDNLDKKLIGNVMIKVLAELKEQRQIIVCTHDPNILVGGDAEQVVVLEAISDRCGKVLNHGSIDNEDIVETVIDLLEGGAEAFEARSRRYGPWIAP
jgi:energy-coupling factor transporter ATP-binding protein EcfA2